MIPSSTNDNNSLLDQIFNGLTHRPHCSKQTTKGYTGSSLVEAQATVIKNYFTYERKESLYQFSHTQQIHIF
jgi:hypothetical protein